MSGIVDPIARIALTVDFPAKMSEKDTKSANLVKMTLARISHREYVSCGNGKEKEVAKGRFFRHNYVI